MHYRSYRGQVLRVKRPNQQCQSTEGRKGHTLTFVVGMLYAAVSRRWMCCITWQMQSTEMPSASVCFVI